MQERKEFLCCALGTPRVAKWLGDIREFFPTPVVQIVQKDAFERLNLKALMLEPEFLSTLEADVHLVADLIALRAAISKFVDRLASINAPGELMNRKIGALPWAVNSEIQQSYDSHLVKLRVGRAKKFASNFCGTVGAESLGEM